MAPPNNGASGRTDDSLSSPFPLRRNHSSDSSTSHSSDGSHPGPDLGRSTLHKRAASSANDGKRGSRSLSPKPGSTKGNLPPPILVYHESARSIVFRDQIRRAVLKSGQSSLSTVSDAAPKNEPILETQAEDIATPLSSSPSGSHGLHQRKDSDADSLTGETTIQIHGFQPNVVPLAKLELGANDNFEPLLESPFVDSGDVTEDPDWTPAEREVVQLLQTQRAVVKTIKNSDWTPFLHRFLTPHSHRNERRADAHDDTGPHTDNKLGNFRFASFVTSTSLLPPSGRKMRCYGAPASYTTGCVFALPQFNGSDETEEEAVKRTKTWSWPAGYSAKTEFNVNDNGDLINGREEALVSFSTLRQYNEDYISKEDYVVAGRVIKGGLKTVPYNEVFVRIGGRGRIVGGKDCETEEPCSDQDGTGRSFGNGVGLPVALFVRTTSFGHLISMLRTRARFIHILGRKNFRDIPLILISPELGVRVFTKPMQKRLLKLAAQNLNPFQNPMISHKTTIKNTDPECLETKVEELIDLDESIRRTLTPEECVRLAGGFGATDESIAHILKDVMYEDIQSDGTSTEKLQSIVNEGLTAAVRSGDYYTSRQLLILYSLVASEGHKAASENNLVESGLAERQKLLLRQSSVESDTNLLKAYSNGAMGLTNTSLVASGLTPPPPPPPLDTDRLRSATNSDGLLAVLGAAQILRAMKDGSAKKHTEESIAAVEEWVEHGEQSMAFRLASWRDLRAAQGDLKIATAKDSSFMAFVSGKAINNRKNFAKRLKDATAQTDFTDVRFLQAILDMTNQMHSPCLRLELLQYVLGLDNRYSVAHVKRSVELAATCLSIGNTNFLNGADS